MLHAGRATDVDGDPVYHPQVLKRDRLVAGAVLTAALALVAVPGPAGSRSPSGDLASASEGFQTVVLDTVLAGAATSNFDPALRSASALEQEAPLPEPAPDAAVPARPVVAVPTAPAGAIDLNVWRRDGNISWYGPGFYGNRTACGYKLTTTLIGVAHRSLPCGTRIAFRHNGRVVIAPVVDRGPYVSGRQWDMTAGLCKALGHCYTGSIYWKYA
jgi:rare lipoprotein A (peptidoglycan hydrolase)